MVKATPPLYCFIFLLCFTSQGLLAQSTMVFYDLEKLSDAINSQGEEILPIVSQSGDSLFFSRAFHPDNDGGLYSGTDIWLSVKQKDGQWQMATNDLAKWNTDLNNVLIGINERDGTVYFNHPRSPEKGIQFSRFVGGKWTKPQTIPIPGLTSDSYQGFYITPDYSTLLISMNGEGSYGKEDIYVSERRNDGWSKPINLGATINTEEFEIAPFLSKDKKKLFFASKGLNGASDSDIFMAERLYNSWTVWTKPVNLGAPLNSEAFDAYFSITSDSTAIFTSNRDGELADIYSIKFKWKKEAVFPVSNSSANEPEKSYLSKEELVELFGFLFEQKLSFEDNADELNSRTRELLYFIANTLVEHEKVHVEIVSSNSKTELTKKRQTRVSLFFQNNGISPRRISLGSILPETGVQPVAGEISIYFYHSQQDN